MTRRQPRVSIGLPVYNGERYLEECLDSILAQTFEDFELIIADNASTDRTEELCRGYATRDKRITYYRNETNIGIFRNFNRVFQLSSGEYFKWASADDVCHPDLLAKCLEVLDRDQNVILAYPKTTFIGDNGKVLDLMDPGWNLTTDVAYARIRYVMHSGHKVNAFFGLLRAKSLAKTRLFPTYIGGDYRLLGELSLLGKFLEILGRLFFRRIHAGASSQSSGQEWQSLFFFGKSRKISFPVCSRSRDHSLTVIRSDLCIAHKISLLSFIFYDFLAQKLMVPKQFRTAIKRLLKRDPF